MDKRVIIVLVIGIVLGLVVFLIVVYPTSSSGINMVHRSYEVLIDPETNDPNYIMHNPLAIKIGPDDNIYILDQGNKRIMVYDRRMRFVRQIGRVGQGPGEFIEPTDFDIDLEGNIYVADLVNSRISIFDNQGIFKNSFGLQIMPLPRELNLAVDSEKRIYINTIVDSLITVFQSNGERIGAFGEVFRHPVATARHLWNIVALDVDEDDNIWVAFQTKPLVRKYTKSGLLLFEKEMSGPNIDEGKKQERPDPEMKTYVYYLTDIFCLPGGRAFAVGHNSGYQLGQSGEIIEFYQIDFPRIREHGKYFFVWRVAFDQRTKSFYGVSKYDGLVYKF
jgi:hypothetical protein